MNVCQKAGCTRRSRGKQTSKWERESTFIASSVVKGSCLPFTWNGMEEQKGVSNASNETILKTIISSIWCFWAWVRRGEMAQRERDAVSDAVSRDSVV